MKKTRVVKLIIASAVICMGFIFGSNVKADAAELTVKTDAANAKVDVTISDASMNGKNASVVCYAPGWSGNTADWAGNKNYISYMSQVKVNGATTVSFNIKETAPANGNYTLVVSAIGSKLTKSFSFYDTQTPVVSVPKAEPLKITQSAAAEVKLTWEKIAGAKKYTISRATKLKGKYSKIAISKKTSYVDKKVKAGKTYFYKVKANGKTYGPYKITLMKAPKIKVKAAKKSAVLSWKKDGAADGYRVYMATKKNGKYKVVSTVKGSKKIKATVKKLKKGKTYFFKVSAYKNNGKKKVAGKASAIKKVTVK